MILNTFSAYLSPSHLICKYFFLCVNITQELPAWLSLFSSIFNYWKLYKNYQIRDKFVLLIREGISLAIALGIMKTKNREYSYSMTKAERKK